MKKILKVLTLPLIALLIVGCDNFANVSKKTERVSLTRPFEVVNREVGGNILGPWKTGQKNHGNGPTLAYDFNMLPLTDSLTLQVLMKERINQTFVLDVIVQMVEGQSLVAALNFMPDLTKKVVIKTTNDVQVVKVSVKDIYRNNMRPYIEMVARDIIDGGRSKDVNINLLRNQIKAKSIEVLSGVLIPRTTLNPTTNRPVLYANLHNIDLAAVDVKVKHPEAFVNILSVMEIKATTFFSAENPEIINEQIDLISGMESRVSVLTSKLQQKKIGFRIDATDARHLKAKAANIALVLEENPRMMRYKVYTAFKKMVENKSIANTRFVMYPAGGECNPGNSYTTTVAH